MSELNSLNNPITSRQNQEVKRLCSLCEKKERRKGRLFRFDGIKLFCEAVSKGVRIDSVAVSVGIDGERLQKIKDVIDSGALDSAKIIYVSEDVFAKISEEASPEGIVTVAHFLEERHTRIENIEEYFIDARKKILIVEALRDPGNLGTVIRSSAALGIDRLIITDDCADIYSPRVLRATMGALFSIKIDTVSASELPRLILRLRDSGRRIYATALGENARRIGSLELGAGDAFVIGNEGHGLSSQTVEACSDTAIIPMTEGSESLNASAAAAICIWETVRAEKRTKI